MIVCDMDGTLAPSKCSPDIEMTSLIESVLEKYFFAVISGASVSLLRERFLPHINLNSTTEQKLFLLPSIGAGLFILKDGKTIPVYEQLLSEKESTDIIDCIHSVLASSPFEIPQYWGAILEKRGTSVTYSALGQDAPLSEKTNWDPDQVKRQQLLALLSPLLPEYTIAIGGLTSLDITRKNIDKAFGIEQLSKHTNISIKEMFYIGDALYENGNDYAVHKTHIDCIQVSSPEDTKKLFKELLNF